MKTLFMIVSILAFSYLALQTSFVKSYLVSFTQTFDFNSPNNQLENNTNKAFITKINALEKQSASDREMYTQRITELENNVKALKQKQSDTIAIKSDQQVLLANTQLKNADLHHSSALSSKEDKISLLAQKLKEEGTAIDRSNLKSASLQASEAQISQQQKRLQQQAVLRSLSQKMELAALNSLTN